MKWILPVVCVVLLGLTLLKPGEGFFIQVGKGPATGPPARPELTLGSATDEAADEVAEPKQRPAANADEVEEVPELQPQECPCPECRKRRGADEAEEAPELLPEPRKEPKLSL
jgi:hypothetical protein